MKQTAVEWLIYQIYYTDVKITRELLKQAKEMEKQQIKDAYSFGIQDDYVIGSEQYYNETFKSE